LPEVKSALETMVADLGDDCRTLLSGEIRGLVYSLLQEEHGFRVWRSPGPAAGQLERIAREDAALAVARKRELDERAFAALFSSPSGGCGGEGAVGRRRSKEALRAVQSLTESLGDGHFRLDLAGVLARFKNANSKDVLLPLLEDGGFRRLDISCDHLPRWFERKLADLDLRAQVTPTARGIEALVEHLPR
jgi:Fe-only nitrogenase accessory protein AnfO